MEHNSTDDFDAVVVPPSYLVDFNLMSNVSEFYNPLRSFKGGNADDNFEGSKSLEINLTPASNTDDNKNWFETAIYSLYDDYVGARGGLYETKSIIIADKNHNRLMGYGTPVYFGGAEGNALSTQACKENAVIAINDSLVEFKTSSEFDQMISTGDTIYIAPAYHYLQIVNGKLIPLKSERVFACTAFVKLNDYYLKGCYVINGKAIDRVTPEMLRYMKNEIYASYGYQFKNKQWTDIFSQRFIDYYNDNDNAKLNTSVDDSLTAIDKYNINWISQKLKQYPTGQLAAN